MHSHDGQRMAETARNLEQVQLTAMTSVQEFLNVLQLTLAIHVSPASWWSITRWRLRSTVTQVPSTMIDVDSGEHA